MRPLALLATACLVLAGCAEASQASDVAAEIRGEWELTELLSAGGAVPLPSGRATLVVDDEQVGGVSFCNHYSSPYTLRGHQLEITGPGGTDMACEPALMAAEQEYLAALGAGPLEVRLRPAALVLVGEGVELRFRRPSPVPTRELVGTRWVLETLVQGEVAGSATGEPARLELRPDGSLTGSTGCRALTGTWTSTGGTLRFPALGAEGTCPPELQGQDGHVVHVLGEGVTVEVVEDVLTLSAPDGSGLVYRAT